MSLVLAVYGVCFWVAVGPLLALGAAHAIAWWNHRGVK
jgi:hypothetical protein